MSIFTVFFFFFFFVAKTEINIIIIIRSIAAEIIRISLDLGLVINFLHLFKKVLLLLASLSLCTKSGENLIEGKSISSLTSS